MKTLRNIFALFILSVAFYSCDADATLDETQQVEHTEQKKFDNAISADTGDQGNEVDEREG